eukprot:jgi/Mesvir1/25040/Mv16979-RA.1
MSEIFETYDREYNELITSIQRKIETGAALGGEAKRQKFAEINSELAEAQSLLKRMDLEARSLPANIKTGYISKVRDKDAALQTTKRDAKRAETGTSNADARADLLEAARRDALLYSNSSTDQRAALLATTDRIKSSGERLKEGKRALLETEELGVSILQDLHRQRQTIEHARDSLHGADENISKSRKILSIMARRMTANKVIMSGVVVLLVLAIIIIIYYKLVG